MTLNLKSLFGVFILFILVSTGCKKGEGDPMLSLSSRKARVTGEWTATSGNGKINTSTWTYENGVKTTVSPSMVGTSTTRSNIVYNYTFEKDGTYTIVETTTKRDTLNNNNNIIRNTVSTSTTTGTWNFTGKVGDNKNKSQLLLITSSSSTNIVTTTTGQATTNTSTSETYVGNQAPSELFDIYQLKSKEMILKYSATKTVGTTITTNEGEWTLTAN